MIVADHAYDWACYGVCYGCELYCGADELSECCAECSVDGRKFKCWFPFDEDIVFKFRTICQIHILPL